MNILIITQYYYPEQFQINEIAPLLVKRGHNVTVLCGVPNYPKGDFFAGYETKESREIKEEEYFKETGVRVIHCNQYARGHNPATLILNYISFVRNSKSLVHKLPVDFDVVLGYQLSPITSMYAALTYKKKTHVPLIFYTLDLWPVSALSQLHSIKNPIYKFVAKISQKLYQGADKILVTSRPFIDYLHKINKVPFEKMVYLPQHASSEMLEMDLGSENNGIVDFMFAGNLGAGQRIDVIVNAVQILGKRSDYKVHLVGDGSKRKELEAKVIANGLQNHIIFYGNQKRSDMPNFYKMADALLITLRGNNEVGDTMPGKLQMYMTTGKPIFGAINGAAKQVIEEAQCGACVHAGDAEGLAVIMKDYIERSENYVNCGDNAREYFKKHFTLEHFMNGLEKELYGLVKK